MEKKALNLSYIEDAEFYNLTQDFVRLVATQLEEGQAVSITTLQVMLKDVILCMEAK